MKSPNPKAKYLQIQGSTTPFWRVSSNDRSTIGSSIGPPGAPESQQCPSCHGAQVILFTEMPHNLENRPKNHNVRWLLVMAFFTKEYETHIISFMMFYDFMDWINRLHPYLIAIQISEVIASLWGFHFLNPPHGDPSSGGKKMPCYHGNSPHFVELPCLNILYM